MFNNAHKEHDSFSPSMPAIAKVGHHERPNLQERYASRQRSMLLEHQEQQARTSKQGESKENSHANFIPETTPSPKSGSDAGTNSYTLRRGSTLFDMHRAANFEESTKAAQLDEYIKKNSIQEVFDQMRAKQTSKSESSASQSNESRAYQTLQFVIYTAIMVSSVQIGLQVDYPEFGTAYSILEIVCNVIFLVEMVVKLAMNRCGYFRSGWNIFDFSLVMIAIVDFVVSKLAGDSSSGTSWPALRALRMLRAVRVLRMLKVFRELWLIVRGIVLSLRAMTWVILLLVMILYMCGILCTTIMEESGPMYPGYTEIEVIPGGENMEYFNPSESFGTIPRSMYTLFQLALLTEFSEFGRPIFEKQPLFFPFFLFFIFVVTFGVLNVLIAVIVEVTMQASESLKQEEGDREMTHKLELLDQLQAFVFRMDEDGSGLIGKEQLIAVHEDKEMQELLVKMGFPVGFSAEELWTLLDQDGNGSLNVEEFVRMAFRLVSCTQDHFQFSCLLLSSLNRLQQNMCSLQPQLQDTNSRKDRACRKTRAPIRRGCRIRSRTRRRCGMSAKSRENVIEAAKAYVKEVVPEVETNPSGTVSAEQFEQLLADRLYDTLPRQMPPEEIKGLLEWRKADDGQQLKYRELAESLECLAACRRDVDAFNCFVLSSVRQAHCQSAATHRLCKALCNQMHCIPEYLPAIEGGRTLMEVTPMDESLAQRAVVAQPAVSLPEPAESFQCLPRTNLGRELRGKHFESCQC
eukprot:gnl/MRDRNA2_/MRDRNA2_95074_c0_seq1.p1 gnl/MRDRNA2_/MRDRNA2_95074_c0~~gnl/MRDRNA2_/MRDRNA2_95074_c0_seq1.p1  ORF type:complete len:746 (-),score=125.01 gnl/MRDRNA2_/MRDRNA2_95074_c0_seq1:254-2491(-)